uniref:Secologanin synthase n=1 Tax=Aegilops tauschii TaxID=37682 RepID=M8CLY8_AEGTA
MESFSLSLVAVGSAAAVGYLCVAAWMIWPRRVREIFRRQGIDGPPPSSFLMGNLTEIQARRVHAVASAEDGPRDLQKDDGFDDYCKRIFPYFDEWRKTYAPC